MGQTGNYDVLVVGGGPAGMMAAIRASECGAKVILLEKNASLGRKLLLTGKGRCNLTNVCDLETFLKHFNKNGPFLRDAFKEFFNEELRQFFKQRGVALKVERQDRVFPESDKSSSIVRALEAYLKRCHVHMRFHSEASDLIVEKEHITGVRLVEGQSIFSKTVIMATGGMTYKATGSDGKGAVLMSKFSHKMIPFKPALVGLEAHQKYISELEGLTLKNISVSVHNGKRKMKPVIGELLFTSNGISGPLVVSASRDILQWIDEGRKVRVFLDLKPGMTIEQVERRLRKECKRSPKASLKTILRTMIPQRMGPVILNDQGISEVKKASELSSRDCKNIAMVLKQMVFDIKGASSPDQAMISQGGISVREIDPKTMASKRLKGLFVAGEMLDIDGGTGGFNLQAAFSTGYLSGQSAAALC